MAILECKHISKQHKGVSLSDLSCSLEKGSVLGVVGPAKSGKSLLLQILLGGFLLDNMNLREKQKKELVPSPHEKLQGQIIIEGNDLKFFGPEAKRHLAYVLKDCPFSPVLSAKENALLYGPCYDSFRKEEFFSKAEQYHLDCNRGLKHFTHQERILFQIAFASSYDATLYLLDEPFEGLDEDGTKWLRSFLDSLLHNPHAGVILATQNPDFVDTCADSVLWLEKGKTKWFGPKKELLDNYLILSGSVKQVQYVMEQNPELVAGNRYPKEVLIHRGKQKPALRLEERSPSFAELYSYLGEEKKAAEPPQKQYKPIPFEEKGKKKRDQKAKDLVPEDASRPRFESPYD